MERLTNPGYLSPTTKTATKCRYNKSTLHTMLQAIVFALPLFLPIVDALTVAVFGGSGYVGRRICETLVSNGDDVISISRSGKPPAYYCNGNWAESVTWISHDMDPKVSSSTDTFVLPNTIDAAISCIGNINPRPDYDRVSFFGLSHDNDQLHNENGIVNQHVCQVAKSSGAKRFVYFSVSYETAKFLEGPIPGYLSGKRLAESSACKAFGEDNTIVIGPSFIYGGRRFPKFGKLYRSFVDSPMAKAYVNGNEFLRNLSVAPLEDWVERTVFSPPCEVETVARVACGAAYGLVVRDTVGHRKQGFFDTNGKPVVFDDVVFVDGTNEIERVEQLIGSKVAMPLRSSNDSTQKKDPAEPAQEGALLGRGPYLYPLRSATLLALAFYTVVTNDAVVPAV